MSDPIKRFYVRDGFVLDEHPTGQVVRYGHHMARIEKLEAERDRLQAVIEQVVHDLDLNLYGRTAALGYLRAALEEGGDDE